MSLLQSILDHLIICIEQTEENFADTVIADLKDEMNSTENKWKTAYQWLTNYENLNIKEIKMKYTPAGKATKFSEIWDLTNIATDYTLSVKKRLSALDQMSIQFDDDTRDHFRMTLTQVLRDDYSATVRKEAIVLLATYFKWDEIEWTFWCHQKRTPKDSSLLNLYGDYCINRKNNNDIKTLKEILLDEVNKTNSKTWKRVTI